MDDVDFTDVTNELEDKKEFLRSAARMLNWRELGNATILYIFCGGGRKYVRTFLQLFPKIRKVYFTDLMDALNVENILRKTMLFSADIQDKSKLSEYKEFFLHIVSIDCFNWLKDCKSGFENIYYLLKLGGTAAILMNINSPFEDCYKDLIENSSWKFSELGRESLFPKFPVRLCKEEYEKIIQDVGFVIVECEQYNRIFEFDSLLDFYDKCTSFTSPLLAYIPKDQQHSFEDAFLDNFKRLHGLSFRGKQRIKCKTLCIFIHKPITPVETICKPAPDSEAFPTSNSYHFSYFGRI